MNISLSFSSSFAMALKRKREREMINTENMTPLAFNTLSPRIRMATLIDQGKNQEKNKEMDELSLLLDIIDSVH